MLTICVSRSQVKEMLNFSDKTIQRYYSGDHYCSSVNSRRKGWLPSAISRSKSLNSGSISAQPKKSIELTGILPAPMCRYLVIDFAPQGHVALPCAKSTRLRDN